MNTHSRTRPDSRCHIIAEIGVNHDGSLEKAIALVDAARLAGADSVKFQHYTVASLVSPSAKKAVYQTERDSRSSQSEMLEALKLSEDDMRAVRDYCAETGVRYLCTPFDELAALFLNELKVEAFKIGSGDLTHLEFLQYVAKFGKPVILSTGMADLQEVVSAVNMVKGSQDRQLSNDKSSFPRLTVLHCTSAYPAPIDELNLAAMSTIAQACDVPVGYSDHSPGILIAPVAVALGASLVEKHLTLDVTDEGPDHAASIEADQFTEMVQRIRQVERALGNGNKQPSPAEMEIRDVARRSLFAAGPLVPGQILSAKDVVALRPGTGIPASDFRSILGMTIRRSIEAGQMLHSEDLE